MSYTVNLAIQVLPSNKEQPEAYRIVDAAIECIKRSGLKYMVCPFETVIEGPYQTVMSLVSDIQDECYKAGAGAMLINMKLQRNFTQNVYIDDKVGKYKE